MGELIASNHNGDEAGDFRNRSREEVLESSKAGIKRRSALRDRYGWDKQAVLKLGDVPSVVMSEVLADLQVLKSKAK